MGRFRGKWGALRWPKVLWCSGSPRLTKASKDRRHQGRSDRLEGTTTASKAHVGRSSMPPPPSRRPRCLSVAPNPQAPCFALCPAKLVPMLQVRVSLQLSHPYTHALHPCAPPSLRVEHTAGLPLTNAPLSFYAGLLVCSHPQDCTAALSNVSPRSPTVVGTRWPQCLPGPPRPHFSAPVPLAALCTPCTYHLGERDALEQADGRLLDYGVGRHVWPQAHGLDGVLKGRGPGGGAKRRGGGRGAKGVAARRTTGSAAAAARGEGVGCVCGRAYPAIVDPGLCVWTAYHFACQLVSVVAS